MSRPWIVSNEPWGLIEPLLPPEPPKFKPGRPQAADRQAPYGILFVVHTGIRWERLPQEPGFDPGMTCWRRLATDANAIDTTHLPARHVTDRALAAIGRAL